LIQFLLDNEHGATKPVTLGEILDKVHFSHAYTRNGLQHKLIGPLRRDSKVFVGVSSAGVFLVTTPEDVDATLGFYTPRIRAELRHARYLRALAKSTNLLEGYQTPLPSAKQRTVIYLDESGNPNVADLNPPVLVIGAVVIESRQDLAARDQRFRNAHALIKRPATHELRTVGLSADNHAKVLHELSLLDYQWAAACFDKARLAQSDFMSPAAFYRYAFQFLIGDLLTIAWRADLVIDEHSTPAFQAQLEGYLRRQNSGLPVNRLGSVTFSSSSSQRLIQLADLIAGAVRRSVEGERRPLREIEHKMINLEFWPPK
jgi:hypothetical protein